MSELELLGQTREIKTYNLKQTPKSPVSSPGTLRHRPLINPEEFPLQTMRRIFKVVELDHSSDFLTIRDLIRTYQKQGENRKWDEFRHKIPDPLLSLWEEVLSECRRNGFVGPWVEDDTIKWKQLLSVNNAQGDLCTLCSRECRRREEINSGESRQRRQNDINYEEPKPCWEVKNGK
jgi:hypothetical protein